MRITLVILLGTLLSGCSGPVAEFSGTTVIGQGGDVTRSTNYHASHRSNVDKIKERFELPPGGAWHQGSRTVVSEDGIQREIDTFSYELTRHYTAGEAIDMSNPERRATRQHATPSALQCVVTGLWIRSGTRKPTGTLSPRKVFRPFPGNSTRH
jgi:hypothetical protein